MRRRVIWGVAIVALAGLGLAYRGPLLAWGLGTYTTVVAPRLPGALGAGAQETAPGELVASGTVEAHTIAVSSPAGGRLTTVRVAEGDRVAPGELIAELDTTLQDAALRQAQAAVAQAEAQLALLRAGARPADLDVARAAVKQAEAARDAARQGWQDAQALVNAPGTLDVKIVTAQAAVKAAEEQLKAGQANATGGDLQMALWGRTVKLLQEGFDVSIDKLPTKPTFHVEAPSRVLDQALLQWNEASQSTWQAHAQAGIAGAALQTARQNLADLQAQHADPLALQAQANAAQAAYQMAEAAVTTAQANLAMAEAGAQAEQVRAAEALVSQAQAGVQALEAGRENTRILAPAAGGDGTNKDGTAGQPWTVSAVVQHPGEVVGPGGPVVRLADLSEVTVTVYVPETQMGRVRLGQAAQVAVDSFPGRLFAGNVSTISDQAEFTPKNVQTRDQRANTVYAVKISLKNQDGALKPGMPADAYFCAPGAAACGPGSSAQVATGLTLPQLGGAAEPAGGPIQASGTMEGSETTVSAELGARVAEVAVGEGAAVSPGQVLVRLDDGELAAKRRQAQAAVDAARAGLARVSAQPQAERVAQARAQVAQAEAALNGARAGLADAQAQRANPQDLDAQIHNAEAQVDAAAAQIDLQRANLKMAQVLQASLPSGTGSDQDRTKREIYDQQVLAAQAALNAAEAQQRGAQDTLAQLKAIRARPVALDAAVNKARGQVAQGQAGLDVARAALAQVQAPAQPEAVALAQAGVAQAEAAAGLLDATLARLSVTSPVTGTVTSQMIHAGEVAQPGAAQLTLVDLTHVKLAIYVPAARLGQVRLGQAAEVSADAYPGRTFHGVVTHIDEQAEFTPRNVQTQEERVKTVFRVEIALENAGGALKPGMPADALLR